MTAAQAVLAWHRKAALLLESRLRSVVAEDTAYPSGWAYQLRITAGTDTQSSPTGSTPEPTLPAIDLVVRSSEVEDHTTSRTVRLFVDVLATVEIDQSVSSSIYGALTAALADEAANVLVQYGRDPTNGGACYLVVLESSAVPDFGDGALSPQTYRATASIRVELSVPLSVSATYAPAVGVAAGTPRRVLGRRDHRWRDCRGVAPDGAGRADRPRGGRPVGGIRLVGRFVARGRRHGAGWQRDAHRDAGRRRRERGC